jgi:hypothetical protein
MGSRVLVPECDLPVFELNDPVVADRHPEDIRREILEGWLTAAYSLKIDYPLLVPYTLEAGLG